MPGHLITRIFVHACPNCGRMISRRVTYSRPPPRDDEGRRALVNLLASLAMTLPEDHRRECLGFAMNREARARVAAGNRP